MPIDQLFRSMLRITGTSITRAEALSVSAVQRGRNLLASIATLPLVQIGPDGKRVDNPLFRQLDPDVPNVVTLAQTVEDLLMDGIAWWLVTSTDFGGFPMTIRRLDPSSVRLVPPTRERVPLSPSPLPSGEDPRGAVVWVDGQPVAASRVIRFDSPNPGVLSHCGRTLRRCIALEKAALLYAEDPRPLDYFSPAEGSEEPSDEDVGAFLSAWASARRQRATAYKPRWAEYETVDAPTPQQLQLVELQRQAWVEVAQLLGVDAEELSVSTTSRTYFNAIDRRQSRINDVYAPYMRAITDRLSMGDVTRRGHFVTFDLTDYMKADPQTRIAYYQGLRALGAITTEEIRVAEGLGPMPADAQSTPEPEQVEAYARPARTFSDDRLTFVDVPVESFSVNRKERTIEGLALPYGRVAKGVRFERGALRWTDPGRVKLLRDHDPRQPLGVAVSLRDTPKGLLARFRLGTTAAADEALSLAADGILDGLSVGVDFDVDADTVPDPKNKQALLVKRADLREASLTAVPAFDDARLTSVNASAMEGTTMEPDTEDQQTPAAAEQPAVPAQTFTAETVAQLLAALHPGQEGAEPEPGPEPERPATVDPTRPTAATVVREALPYRFDRGGNFLPPQPGLHDDHVFSADLHEMALARDAYGDRTEAGKRVMGLLRAVFDTDSADVSTLNPAIQRPDMYVDQQDFRYPIWTAINKGAPPNGIQPFTFPKFNSASGLVADHIEGTEPTSGSFTATSQTVTPTPVSGKANLTREVWDMGGNPAVSTLIFNQMVRGYREGLETAAATFLNTLTAAADIDLGVGVVDEALQSAWDSAVADLQFERGYDFSVFVLEKVLYKAFVAAVDGSGRKLYPQINPQNANGTATSRFARLDLAGVVGVPSWALPSTAGAANNSWLFDPMFVHGWATAPQRLDFPGAADDNSTYQPVAKVQIAIWGYKALANSDIAAVRQVIYDSAA
ncbi:MAG TPA: phage portal protein [Micromonosporaceae bacterium]